MRQLSKYRERHLHFNIPQDLLVILGRFTVAAKKSVLPYHKVKMKDPASYLVSLTRVGSVLTKSGLG